VSIPAARPQSAEGFANARALVAYLLSLSAVAHAMLAWNPEAARPAGLALYALVLALAVLGGGVAARFPAITGWAGGPRARAVVGLAYAGLIFVAPPLVAVEPRLAASQAAVFAALQPVSLLLAQLGHSPLLVVQNALVLVALASLRGGGIAAAAATGYVGLLGPFLAFDHCARTLAAFPPGRGSLVRVALRRAMAITGPVVLTMAAIFVIAPPRPAARTEMEAPAPVATREIAGAYQVLVSLGLLGGAGVYFVGRLVIRRRRSQPPLAEMVEPRPVAEEVLEPPRRAPHAEYPGRRGRIVRAYVSFLAQSARLASRRRPHQTPREFQAHLRGPAGPLGTLTELFMAARYGPDEPREEEAVSAERAAAAVVAALRSGRPDAWIK